MQPTLIYQAVHLHYNNAIFYTGIMLIQNKLALGPCKKSRVVSLTSLIMGNINVCPAWSRLPINSNCCIDLGSESSCCLLLKINKTSLYFSLKPS